MIKIGDNVNTKFGIAAITHIELCEAVGEKYGIAVVCVSDDDKDLCVFDLDNKHWQYGTQINKL
tara:strand:- start:321 stop:512 length:192 start_codon:yes stop_codon:yes gene_type:complete